MSSAGIIMGSPDRISPLTPAQLQRPSAVCLHCLLCLSICLHCLSPSSSISCVHCIDQLGTAVKCVPSNRTQTLHYRRGGAGAIVKWVPSVWVMVSGVGVLCTVYPGDDQTCPCCPSCYPCSQCCSHLFPGSWVQCGGGGELIITLSSFSRAQEG